MGVTKTSNLCLEMFNDSFGMVNSPILAWQQLTMTHSWRVALMEKSVALLDFDNVDQMIQIHGMLQLCDCVSRKFAE